MWNKPQEASARKANAMTESTTILYRLSPISNSVTAFHFGRMMPAAFLGSEAASCTSTAAIAPCEMPCNKPSAPAHLGGASLRTILALETLSEPNTKRVES